MPPYSRQWSLSSSPVLSHMYMVGQHATIVYRPICVHARTTM